MTTLLYIGLTVPIIEPQSTLGFRKFTSSHLFSVCRVLRVICPVPPSGETTNEGFDTTHFRNIIPYYYLFMPLYPSVLKTERTIFFLYEYTTYITYVPNLIECVDDEKPLNILFVTVEGIVGIGDEKSVKRKQLRRKRTTKLHRIRLHIRLKTQL